MPDFRNRCLLAAAALLMVPLGAGATAPDPARWSEPACSDAAFGGRAAFRCHTTIGSDPAVRVTVWATPAIQAELNFSGRIAARTVPRAYSGTRLADPVDLKLDGKTTGTFASGQFLYEFAYSTFLAFTIRIDEPFLKALADASQLGVEFTDPQGARQLAKVALAPEVAALAAHAQARYHAYYKGGGKAALAKPIDVDPAIWGLLGEAADRSRFWAFQDSPVGAEMLDLTWLQPDREMRLRRSWCYVNGQCGEYAYVVRATTDAIVDNQPRQVLTVYNESGKPYMRYEGMQQKELFFDKKLDLVDYDPVLVRDMKGHPAGELSLYTAKDESCCIRFGSRKYRPATAGEVEAMFAGQREKLEQARQHKEQEAREQRERTERLAQAGRIPPDANGEPDRGPDVVPQRAPMSLAESLQNTLQAGRERDAQQGRFLARVERDAGAASATRPPSTASAGGGSGMYFLCFFGQASGPTFYSQVGRIQVPRDQYTATKARVEAAYADYIRDTRKIARSADTSVNCESGVTEAEMTQRRADGKARVQRLGLRRVADTDWVPRL